MLYSSTTDLLSSRFGIERAVEILVSSGFSAIDFSMFRLNEAPFEDGYRALAKKLREYANSRGVVFNQGHAPFGRSNYTEYMTELLPLFPRCIEFASLLGIKNLVIHPTHPKPYYGNEAEIYEENFKIFKSLAPYAKDFGVKIAIENMWSRNPKTGRICDAFGADPKELYGFYSDLGDKEAFTICLDIGHVALCGREPEVAIEKIGREALGALHVHDVDCISDLHTLPGCAKLNYDKMCRALAKINYSGDITLEADSFLGRFDTALLPNASRFMADVARELRDRVERYKKEAAI